MDITVIKRSTADQLRNGAPKGRKVMLIWDKACIDYRLWFKLEQSHAIFECLAHNLLMLFEQYLRQSEGLRDELEEQKQQGRSNAAAVASNVAPKGVGIIRTVGNFINTALHRATQRTLVGTDVITVAGKAAG